MRAHQHTHWQINRIELYKTSKGLGFSIAGGVDNEHVPGDTGIFVTKIIEGGAAQIDGRLQMGDKLISVGPVSLENVTHEQAVEILKATQQRVTLAFVKNPYPGATPVNVSEDELAHHMRHTNITPSGYRPITPQGYSAHQPVAMPEPQRYIDHHSGSQPQLQYAGVQRAPRTVHLTKGAQGLGFNIVGGEDDEGIYISAVLPGGVADLSGQVYRGDQLLQVNNTNLTSATHEQAAQALKQSGQHVTIVCQYKPEGACVGKRSQKRVCVCRVRTLRGAHSATT
jgi:C-terminal processing protease CtpA/Prc